MYMHGERPEFMTRIMTSQHYTTTQRLGADYEPNMWRKAISSFLLVHTKRNDDK